MELEQAFFVQAVDETLSGSCPSTAAESTQKRSAVLLETDA
jgi:hypothetical protein